MIIMIRRVFVLLKQNDLISTIVRSQYAWSVNKEKRAIVIEQNKNRTKTC